MFILLRNKREQGGAALKAASHSGAGRQAPKSLGTLRDGSTTGVPYGSAAVIGTVLLKQLSTCQL